MYDDDEYAIRAEYCQFFAVVYIFLLLYDASTWISLIEWESDSLIQIVSFIWSIIMREWMSLSVSWARLCFSTTDVWCLCLSSVSLYYSQSFIWSFTVWVVCINADWGDFRSVFKWPLDRVLRTFTLSSVSILIRAETGGVFFTVMFNAYSLKENIVRLCFVYRSLVLTSVY